MSPRPRYICPHCARVVAATGHPREVDGRPVVRLRSHYHPSGEWCCTGPVVAVEASR